jgi:hypothetical protein
MGNLHRVAGSSRRGLILAAALTSALLSLLFLVVYSTTNWLTSQRGDVGTWYYEWERFIRHCEAGKTWLRRKEKKHGTAKALAILGRQLGRTAYHLWRKREVFDKTARLPVHAWCRSGAPSRIWNDGYSAGALWCRLARGTYGRLRSAAFFSPHNSSSRSCRVVRPRGLKGVPFLPPAVAVASHSRASQGS